MNINLFLLRFLNYSIILLLPLLFFVSCDIGHHNSSVKPFISTATTFQVGDTKYMVSTLQREQEIKAVIYPKKNSLHFVHYNDQEESDWLIYFQTKIKMEGNTVYCFSNDTETDPIMYLIDTNNNPHSANIDILKRKITFFHENERKYDGPIVEKYDAFEYSPSGEVQDL